MKVAIPTLCLVLVILALKSGLDCYECSGEDCSSGGFKAGNGIGSIKSCPSITNDTIKTFCYKYVQGDSPVSRGCVQTWFNQNGFQVHPNSTVECVVFNGDTHCICDTDSCNGSNELLVSTIWSLGIPIINLFFVINIC